MHKFLIHTDGGSRGNPGPAAIGVIIDGQLNRQDLFKQVLPVGRHLEAKLPSGASGNGSLANSRSLAPRIRHEIGRKEYGKSIGVTTNNEAEYQAVIFGLKKLKQLIGNAKAEKAHVTFYMDSELLVKQLNHQYKVKEENIQKLFLEVHNLRLDFGKVEFKHVLRGKNTDADLLVNQVLDRESNKLDL